jgi:hypothetical protein
MTQENNIKVQVKENDRIMGSSRRETTLDKLTGWGIDNRDVQILEQGGTVKCVSPNGTRVIEITMI